MKEQQYINIALEPEYFFYWTHMVKGMTKIDIDSLEQMPEDVRLEMEIQLKFYDKLLKQIEDLQKERKRVLQVHPIFFDLLQSLIGSVQETYDGDINKYRKLNGIINSTLKKEGKQPWSISDEEYFRRVTIYKGFNEMLESIENNHQEAIEYYRTGISFEEQEKIMLELL